MADCRVMKALLEDALFIYYFKKQSLEKKRACIASNCRQCGATKSDLKKDEDKLAETVELIRALNPVCRRKHLPLCEPCRMISQQLEEFESKQSWNQEDDQISKTYVVFLFQNLK